MTTKSPGPTRALLDTIDAATLRAIAAASLHPTQLAILVELNETDEAMSPKQLADRLDVGSLPSVSYHVRVLARRELIKLERTAPIRGAVEHFYRLTEQETR